VPDWRGMAEAIDSEEAAARQALSSINAEDICD
jgi:hypothetical protein